MDFLKDLDLELLKKYQKNIIKNCKKCKGLGFINSCECECSKEFSKIIKFSEAKIPEGYWLDKNLKSRFENSIVFNKIVDFVENLALNVSDGKGLILIGKSNLKTDIAVYILKQAICKYSFQVKFVPFEQVVYFSNFFLYPFERSEKQFFFNLLKFDIICFDKFDYYDFSENQKICLKEFFNFKNFYNKSMILTSQISLTQLNKFFEISLIKNKNEVLVLEE